MGLSRSNGARLPGVLDRGQQATAASRPRRPAGNSCVTSPERLLDEPFRPRARRSRCGSVPLPWPVLSVQEIENFREPSSSKCRQGDFDAPLVLERRRIWRRWWRARAGHAEELRGLGRRSTGGPSSRMRAAPESLKWTSWLRRAWQGRRPSNSVCTSRSWLAARPRRRSLNRRRKSSGPARRRLPGDGIHASDSMFLER